MAEKGQVIGLKNNESLAVIKMTRLEACAKCKACIAGMTEKEMFVEAENMCDAKVNDWVEVELEPNGFMNAVLIMYGLPFVAFMAGVLLGYFVIGPMQSFINIEIFSFVMGLIFTFATFLWNKSQEKRWSQKKYKPKAVRLTSEGLYE